MAGGVDRPRTASVPPGAEVGFAPRIPARVRVSSTHLFPAYPRVGPGNPVNLTGFR